MMTMPPYATYKSIVLMGKVASGKGTQTDLLCAHLDAVKYSNGDHIRSALKSETPFGRNLKTSYEKGDLVPEWVVSYWMMHAILHEHSDEQIVFEGVARKPKEAHLFHEIHEWIERPYIVFHFDVSDDVVRERSLGRGRDVLDTLDVIERRLEEYRTHTMESLAFFKEKGTLVDINGMQDPTHIHREILKHLSKNTQ